VAPLGTDSHGKRLPRPGFILNPYRDTKRVLKAAASMRVIPSEGNSMSFPDEGPALAFPSSATPRLPYTVARLGSLVTCHSPLVTVLYNTGRNRVTPWDRSQQKR